MLSEGSLGLGYIQPLDPHKVRPDLQDTHPEASALLGGARFDWVVFHDAHFTLARCITPCIAHATAAVAFPARP